MRKYALPPRADLANKVLIVLHLLSIVALVFAEKAINAGVFAKIAFVLALVIGLILKHPLVYGSIIIICCLGIVLSLSSYNVAAFAIAALQLAMVVYIRKNLHVLQAAALKE